MRTETISILLVVLIIFSSALVFDANLTYAKNNSKSSLPGSPQVAITNSVVEDVKDNQQIVNSYELFWPLVAGKTERDSLYFLKLLKEGIQGWFIGRDSKKADYEILLGTKRMLEAEVLIKDNKIDSALKTLGRANSNFSKAYDYIKTADSKKQLSTSDIRRERLTKLRILIDYLKTIASTETSSRLDPIKEKIDRVLGDYLP